MIASFSACFNLTSASCSVTPFFISARTASRCLTSSFRFAKNSSAEIFAALVSSFDLPWYILYRAMPDTAAVSTPAIRPSQPVAAWKKAIARVASVTFPVSAVVAASTTAKPPAAAVADTL